MISSPTNLQPYKSPLNKGIPKNLWQYGSKNIKICICKYSREETSGLYMGLHLWVNGGTQAAHDF